MWTLFFCANKAIFRIEIENWNEKRQEERVIMQRGWKKDGVMEYESAKERRHVSFQQYISPDYAITVFCAHTWLDHADCTEQRQWPEEEREEKCERVGEWMKMMNRWKRCGK